MKTRPFLAAFLAALFVSAFFLPAGADNRCRHEAAPGWQIDRDMKFNFGYLPAAAPKTACCLEKPRDLGFGAPFSPDITNINFKGFSDLGFPVPKIDSPESHNFFIKLFEFPDSFVPRRSSMPIVEGFALDRVPGGGEIVGYSLDKRNLAVKMSLIAKSGTAFTPTNPFPAFAVGVHDDCAQREFNDAVIFSSLYLAPGTAAPKAAVAGAAGDDELARQSAGGVLAFHRDILETYRRDLTPLPAGGAEGKFYLFGAKNGEKKGVKTVLTVIRVPFEPMTFANWREMPMPHNPSKIFLTGLLLLYKDEYTSRTGFIPGAVPPVGSPEFEATFIPKSSHVLEIGSVVKLK